MENSSSRTLEITVLSAEDLRIHGRSVKKNAFAIVKVDPFNFLGTKPDPVGGSYPSWDEKFVINLPMGAKHITLEVQCKTSSADNRLIGTANLPLSDIIGGYVPENYLHFLSYMLKDGKGNKSGIINISVRVKVPEQDCSSQGKSKVVEHADLKVAGYASCSALRMGIIPIGEKKFDGVVTGVPAWPPNQL